ncbi:6-phosphofructokinase [Candidatus Saganbacteria bacterium]|nr:6-phosphofructokinase [Candidatus Saganbacteria bacterium]
MALQIRRPQEATPFTERMRRLNLRVAILHSGGPAPGGNRVISAAAKQFLDRGIEVVGVINGYEYLQQGKALPLREGTHFIDITPEVASRAIDQNSLIINTSRANPGKPIEKPQHLDDLEKTFGLRKVLDVFEMLRVGALISIGGDDTLKTANFLYRIARKVAETMPDLFFTGDMVHVPKTIDNDYTGIAFTYGYMTAAESAGRIIRGLYDDARATNCYHVVECMGRKAGWFTAGASIFGRATKALIPEDFEGVKVVDLEKIADDLVELVIKREQRNKNYGVITVAEGLADKLPEHLKKGMRTDRHGQPKLADAKIGERLAEILEEKYLSRTGRKKSFKPQMVGYETRQNSANLYDALLTSQLGVGAFRLLESGRSGEMVTVVEDLVPEGIPFANLIDPATLRVVNRNIDVNGPFYALLRSLEESF